MIKLNVEVNENESIAGIAAKIAKQLVKNKQLSNGHRQQLKIGNGITDVEVIENGMIINVTRKLGKHQELKKCHCGVEYMSESGFKYKTNYGGNTRTLTVCSEKCFTAIKEFAGDRVAPIRHKLNSVIPKPDFISTSKLTDSHKSENTITIKNENDILSFLKNGIIYEPDFKELKVIYSVLRLTR